MRLHGRGTLSEATRGRKRQGQGKFARTSDLGDAAPLIDRDVQYLAVSLTINAVVSTAAPLSPKATRLCERRPGLADDLQGREGSHAREGAARRALSIGLDPPPEGNVRPSDQASERA